MRLLELAAVAALAACGGPDDPPPGVGAGMPPASGGSPAGQPQPPGAADPGACAAHVTLHVSDAMGGPVADVEVRGLTMSCMNEASETVCAASPPPGSYDVVVGAPGYDEAHVSLTVGGTSSGMGGDCSQSIELGVTLQRRM